MNETDTEKLKDMMEDYVELNAKIKSLKTKKETLRTEVLTLLKIHDINAFESDEAKLTFSSYIKNSIDKDTLISYLEENTDKTIEDFQIETTQEKLVIKEVK